MFGAFPEHLRPSDPRFGSGPSLVLVDSLHKLAATGKDLMGTSHRKLPVINLVKEIQDQIRQYFQLPTDYQILLGNGGASLLFDMIGLGLVEHEIHHHICGEFSQKWFQSSQLIPWIKAISYSVDFGQGISGEKVKGRDVVAITLNETSTGVQMDCCPTVDKDTLLAVDATSGGGQIPWPVNRTDVFFFAPQKVFGSEGGTWIAILSPKAIKRITTVSKLNRYIPVMMNWELALENSLKHQTYNTPAIASLFLLNEQLKVMNQIGYSQVVVLAQKKAAWIYQWAEDRPYLSPYVQEVSFRSIAVATIDIVSDKISAEGIIKYLEQQRAVYGIDGYRKLNRNQFRIALFHNITFSDLQKLTQLIDYLASS